MDISLQVKSARVFTEATRVKSCAQCKAARAREMFILGVLSIYIIYTYIYIRIVARCAEASADSEFFMGDARELRA